MNCNNCLASEVCTHKINIHYHHRHDDYCWYTVVVVPKSIINNKHKNQKEVNIIEHKKEK